MQIQVNKVPTYHVEITYPCTTTIGFNGDPGSVTPLQFYNEHISLQDELLQNELFVELLSKEVGHHDSVEKYEQAIRKITYVRQGRPNGI